jgi:hypothetical protein
MHLRWAIFGFWLLFCVLPGCNRSGLNLAYVDGVVTYNGQPVEHAGVIFKPDTGPFAMGTTDGEGKFTLITANHPGALIGEHKVGISKTQTTATAVAGARFPRYDVKHHIPERYASPVSSELTATVSKSKSKNHFKFELTGPLSGS